MVLAGETVTAFTELITPLHPTNGPWQFLTLFESQRFSPQGKKKNKDELRQYVTAHCAFLPQSGISACCHGFIITRSFVKEGRGNQEESP